jgi:hypothetical protein
LRAGATVTADESQFCVIGLLKVPQVREARRRVPDDRHGKVQKFRMRELAMTNSASTTRS